MKLKPIALACAAAFMSVMPAKATGTFDEHKHLYNTIQAHGVTIKINDPRECNKGIDGSYYSRNGILHICQDNARPGGPEIDWTANDLDTLRHEAHHMVQDCVLGRLGDSQLKPLYGDRRDVMTFVRGTIGEQMAHRLMNGPAYRDAPDHVKLTEMEAFAAAAHITPVQIADKLNELCRA